MKIDCYIEIRGTKIEDFVQTPHDDNIKYLSLEKDGVIQISTLYYEEKFSGKNFVELNIGSLFEIKIYLNQPVSINA